MMNCLNALNGKSLEKYSEVMRGMREGGKEGGENMYG